MQFDNDIAAIEAVQTRLIAQFSADGDYWDHYSKYGGVDVVKDYDESKEPEQIGKPMVMLQLVNGDRSEWSSNTGDFRMVEMGIEIRVSDFNGAIVGAANPVSTDQLLAEDLLNEFTKNRMAWFNLGVFVVSAKPGALQGYTGNSNADDVRTTNHKVIFHYNQT